MSDFSLVNVSLVLSIPPIFAANPKAGAEELLDSMVMRYIPSLQGVVISHSNLKFIDKAAHIQTDCPFLVSTVSFDTTVWNPRVASVLSGKINLSSPDHISLLVHRTFNVSIPRHHIPADQWEFEYGPAENDPEFGHEDVLAADETEENTETKEHQTTGRWVHKLTGEPLGGSSRMVEFTVIGLTHANEMLSLVGSLQPDPFSPTHQASSKDGSNKVQDSDTSSSSEDDDEEEKDEEGDNDNESIVSGESDSDESTRWTPPKKKKKIA